MAHEPGEHRARLAAAVDAIQKQRARIHELEDALAATREPIAIVGVGCRFPGGADDEATFWERLREGFDAIREIPPDRFPIEAFYQADADVPGGIATRWGGFLDGIDRFDARFFQVSPREAESMDPQQRVLLEVTWQALEHAGIPPLSLAGSVTGVFVGLTSVDYARVISRQDLSRIDTYCATGNVANIAAGRLSYVFGLRGPSVAVDTACSSSLVSLHLACQSLRTGESEMAIAAGVNVMVTPDNFVAVSRAHMLSPDGRCKAFDRSADGYGRSEGCGVIVLKRLSRARADNDRVLGVILGSAVRQDGQRSGLTVPNGTAQRAVMEAALANARVAARDVGYLEAHGTGTALGDPIEFEALGSVYGQGRARSMPLIVGSLKTNVGHMESAAGIGGVIKTALVLRHGLIPPHLHFREPNPEIDLTIAPATIPVRATGWPDGYTRRLGAVSSFGSSGTIAHVILAAADEPVEPSLLPHGMPVLVLPLSARSETALEALTARYIERLAGVNEPEARDICYTAATGRSHLSSRRAVAGRSARELADQLAGRAMPPSAASEVAPPRDESGRAGMFDAEQVCRAYEAGQEIDWRTLAAGWGPCRRVDVPAYPFQRERHWIDRPAHARPSRPVLQVEPQRGLRFGVMFFNGSEPATGGDRYELLLEATRYADANGFSSVWVPERHFTGFGGLYPNPATIHAGLARETHNLRLMAGSVVLPLHDPLRVAEEWAVVDNLSGGRVGLSFASGWNPDDFVLRPAGYADRRESVFGAIETLRRLWRGERMEATNALGAAVSIRTFPSPVQRELPVWVTAAGNPETFRRAGEIGAHLLTHLLDHDVEELAGKIAIYRQARAEAAHDPSAGQVTVMLHTFVGTSPEMVDSHVREPYCQYLKENAGLLKGLAANRGSQTDVTSLPAEDLDGFVRFLYDRFSSTRALLGTVDSCLPLLDGLEAAGVNEIACLLDFGPATADVLRQLPLLRLLVERAREEDRPRFSPGTPSAAATRLPSGAAYEVQWRRVVFAHTTTLQPAPASWTVLDDHSEVGRTLSSRLALAGSPVVTAAANSLDAEDTAQLLADAILAAGSTEVACSWQTTVDDHDAEAVARGLLRVSRLLRALTARRGERQPRLWFFTRGAYPAEIDGAADASAWRSAAQAALAGLVKVLPVEQLPSWGGIIDLDPAGELTVTLDRAIAAISHPAREDQLLIRRGEVFAARLSPARDPEAAPPWAFRAGVAYLVTGGFGGIGIDAARWVAEKGGTHVVLMGRTVPQEDERLARLRTGGTLVETVALDLGDRRALDGWLAGRREAGAPPIAGVIHAAGVWEDHRLVELEASTLGAVLTPKVAGMLALEAAFPVGTLDLFVAFSAFSAVLPPEGQANYAAANAFMDARIAARRAQGERAITVNWGPWADIGFATTAYGARAHARLKALGITRLTPAQGWAFLDRLIASNRSGVALIPVDWGTFFRTDPNARLSPLLSELVGAWAGEAGGQRSSSGELAAGLQALGSSEQLPALRSAIVSVVVQVMRVGPHELDNSTPLTALGLDSLMAVEIKNRLQHDTGLSVPLVQLLEGPSVEQLATDLLAGLKLSKLAGGGEGAPGAEDLEEVEI